MEGVDTLERGAEVEDDLEVGMEPTKFLLSWSTRGGECWLTGVGVLIGLRGCELVALGIGVSGWQYSYYNLCKG